VWCAAPCPVSFPLDRLVVAEPEPPAEAAQRLQLRPLEPAHLPHQFRHVAGKDLGDQPTAPLGQRDGDEATVVAPALLLDEAAADEVAHHHRGVAVAAKQLLAELALVERPVVE
jgi:hypothetical protein